MSHHIHHTTHIEHNPHIPHDHAYGVEQLTREHHDRMKLHGHEVHLHHVGPAAAPIGSSAPFADEPKRSE